MNDQTTDIRDALSNWMEASMRRYFQGFGMLAKERGLSFSRLSTLYRLEKKGRCTVSDISHQLEISNAASSQLLDKLVQLGLIQRLEDPVDRRIRYHEISTGGRALIHELESLQHGWILQIEDLLTENEKKSVAESLQLLNTKMQELERQSRPSMQSERDGNDSTHTHKENSKV